MQDTKKIQRLEEINTLIAAFCKQQLTDDYLSYALELSGRLSRKRHVDISSGRVEVWAAAIVYVIARLNFLFDKENPHCITVDTICDFFGTKKSTTGNKATNIEKTCNLHLGEPGLCLPEITDRLTFYRTSDGFIVPKSQYNNNKMILEVMNTEESKEFETKFEELLRQEKEARDRRRAKQKEQLARKQEQKKKEKAAKIREQRKDQMDIFG